MNQARFDQLIRGLATKRLSKRQVFNTFTSIFAGRRGNNGVPHLLLLEGHNTLVQHIGSRLSRRLNIFDLLLFALVIGETSAREVRKVERRSGV